MDKMVVMVLKDYYHRCLFPPGKDWPDYYFKKRSCERWVCNEVISRINKCPNKSPYLIMEEFANELDSYYLRDKADHEMFKTARDEAVNLLEIFN